MTPLDEVPWTPGEWRAEPDEHLHGALHVEEMRKVDPTYQPEHKYWVVHSWRDNAGAYVAETGCHELSEANARLIAAAPELYLALDALAKKFAQMIELSPHSDPEQQEAEEKALSNALSLFSRLGRGK